MNETHTIIEMDEQDDNLAERLDNALGERDRVIERFNIYQGFVNAIDDYFEYRCKSPEDQKEVHRMLKNLTDLLTEHNKV